MCRALVESFLGELSAECNTSRCLVQGKEETRRGCLVENMNFKRVYTFGNVWHDR